MVYNPVINQRDAELQSTAVVLNSLPLRPAHYQPAPGAP